MKKIIVKIGMLICFLLITFNVYASDNAIGVFLDGKKINFDENPIIMNDRTLVQMRTICDNLNASVEWDDETREIKIYDILGTQITMQIDNSYAQINDEQIELDAPPVIHNDFTFVPLRVISEVFNIDVEWYSEYNIASLLTKDTKILKNTINLPNPELLFTYVKLFEEKEDEIIFYIQNVGTSVDAFEYFVDKCKDLGYEEISETIEEVGEQNEQISYIRLYNADIPNRIISIGTSYSQEYNDVALYIFFNSACKVYQGDLIYTIDESDLNSYISNGWSLENPYIGKEYWIHKSIIANFIPTWWASLKPYTHIKVVGIAATQDDLLTYPAVHKEITKMYIEAYDTIYECDISSLMVAESVKTSLEDSTSSFPIFIPTIFDCSPQLFYGLSDEEWEKIQMGTIYIGMPKKEFLIINGNPTDKNTTVGSNGTLEQYIYRDSSSSQYYYFENDILTSYQY